MSALFQLDTTPRVEGEMWNPYLLLKGNIVASVGVGDDEIEESLIKIIKLQKKFYNNQPLEKKITYYDMESELSVRVEFKVPLDPKGNAKEQYESFIKFLEETIKVYDPMMNLLDDGYSIISGPIFPFK